MEYILYCDESSDKGEKYGDFFGGCLVESTYLNNIINTLENKKKELNLNGEIKWSKTTENYLEKYKDIMDTFFSFVKEGKIKVRIMFRNMNDLPSNLSVRANSDDKYFKMYYQFIKHAFGLSFIRGKGSPIFLRIYLDQLPDKKDKCEKFKDYLYDLQWTSDFFHSPIKIRKEDIAEVISHDHVLLQCTDIILGAMYYRLNDLHKRKQEGSTRRGKRTIAKEKLYKHINKLIQEFEPHFNIGISTGDFGYTNPRWEMPYRHWRFKPR